MIPVPAWLTFLLALVTDASKHFLLAFSMGALVYALTSIISYAGLWAWERLTRHKVSMGVVYGTIGCCLLVGLSFALASHWLLDYFSTWWVTPLGPGLDLVY